MGNWKIEQDLRYAKSDEWLRVDGDEATIGITDYAQDQLSDIVFVEMPVVGDSLSADEAFGVVESVKAAADLKMPVSGEVIAINSDLDDVPEVLNEDPYGRGWIIKIKISDPAGVDALMDAGQYSAYCDERA